MPLATDDPSFVFSEFGLPESSDLRQTNRKNEVKQILMQAVNSNGVQEV